MCLTPPSRSPSANGVQVSLFFPQCLRSPPPSLPSFHGHARHIQRRKFTVTMADVFGEDSWILSPPIGGSGEVHRRLAYPKTTCFIWTEVPKRVQNWWFVEYLRLITLLVELNHQNMRKKYKKSSLFALFTVIIV